ncbi:MAG: M15 family metallopeptidase [Rubrivivax sp.]|nr:M15 family metallopeptidase [Rubrivivax sp.]
MNPLPMLHVEAIASQANFRRLASLRGVPHDLRYAGTNNFAGLDLYGAMDCAWLRSEAADGLEAAAAWLAARRPGWRILVLDALRPQRVQEAIWQDVVGTPMEHYFANPQRGSIHSFGMAVDVTLIDPEGRESDMGSGFDEMSEASHPALHAAHLASGVLSPAQVAERDCLHDAMMHGGFHGIPTEWWHFDHGDRERVRRELPRIW